MLVFVPMAGYGDRYIRAGFKEPKPLIPVAGKPMIERVLHAFEPASSDVKFLFSVNAQHAKETALVPTLERLVPGAPVIVIEPHKDGPVRTLLDCAEHIPDDEEVVLNYCDFGVDWSFTDFRAWLAAGKWDGAMTAYRGFHPHSLGPTLYAYMKSEGDRVTEIREKHHFTEDKLSEYASSGLYYFKSGRRMKEVARKLVERGERVNGEFYVSMLMQVLIEDGGSVGVYPLKHFYQWGTPEDLRDFEAWLDAVGRFDDFVKTTSETPSRASQVIPMAGRGQRFVDQGYADPKPLVPVKDVRGEGSAPMIVRALGCLPKPPARVLVAQKEHTDSPRFQKVAADLGGKIIAIDGVTEGQACTAKIGLADVPAEAPVLFAPCDTGYLYDPAALRKLEESGEWDAIAWTAKGHLPAIWRPQMYGWVKVEGGRIVKTAVKQLVDGLPASEQEVITGTFWFKSAAFFREEEEAMEKDDDRVRNEFYIDTMIRRLVDRGAKVAAFTVDKYLPWGTPEELKTFEYYSEVRRIYDARK